MYVHTQGASAPSVFSFESNRVRVVADEHGEPWFCASDVCAVLEYVNTRDAIAKHCRPKGVAKRDTLTSGGAQALLFINEPNLYRLIIKSRKPEAERFEAWVMEDVLPAIRKTGRYEAPAALPNPFAYDPKQVAGQRYLVSFSEDGHQFSAKPIPGDACVMTPAQFAKALSTPNGLYVESCTLSDLIVHAARRLECRVRG